MNFQTSNLRPDGTTWPPVTPDPPPPPGYVDPIPELDAALGGPGTDTTTGRRPTGRLPSRTHAERLTGTSPDASGRVAWSTPRPTG